MSDTRPWPADMVERLAVRKVEDSGTPFLHYRDDAGALQITRLPEDRSTVVIGRGGGGDIVLAWDERVSRVHARLQPVGDDWTIQDDGLSRNGTFVNGERVPGHRRLRDRDVVQVGHTALVFRAPGSSDDAMTVGASRPVFTDLSPAQRRVLQALCRPTIIAGHVEVPATNEEIAKEVFLSVDAVKAHLRQLFKKFAIEDLPQNLKRARLVRLAVDAGLVTPGDSQPQPPPEV
jgi:pSer/pThr/pTyr-binding forkhead associated (FHA) protein